MEQSSKESSKIETIQSITEIFKPKLNPVVEESPVSEIILERLSANQSNQKNHDENSSENSDTCYKEYYAIIMTFGPKLLEGIKDMKVRGQMENLLYEPLKYLD